MGELCGMCERYEKLLHMSENLKRIYTVAGTPYTGHNFKLDQIQLFRICCSGRLL